jgi:hypothetical protein
MNKNNKILKMVVITIILLFVASSAAQAIVIINKSSNKSNLLILDDTYTWKDEFDNGQKIDMEHSENYILENGKVKMFGTEPMWTDSSFSRMRVINLNSQIADSDCAIKIIVDYDSDMKSDYGDLRFKFQNDDYWLDYWIENKNPDPNNPYAIVWLKIATLPQGQSKIYMFYGNPSAVDQSSYWAVFDENSWTKEHAHDHQVTYHWYKEGAWDPDVAWGNNRYLVTWEEGTAFWPAAGTIFQQQIRGQYFDSDGNPTSERFDIVDEPDETPPYRYENPASAYGKNGKFLVAYNAYLNPLTNLNYETDIEIAIVDSPSDGVSTRRTLCNAPNIQMDPCVAFDSNNQRFFVVWEDAREGTNNYNIIGRFVGLDGNPINDEKIICSRPNSQCEPWITFDSVNNHYMIVWEEGIDPEEGPFEIWGQIFDANGNPLGSATRLSQQSSDSTDYNFPCVAFCELTETYLVTWNDCDISSEDWNGNVWGKMLNENGNVEVETFQIARGSYCRTNAIPYLSTSFFVAYDSLSGSSGDIWGKMVNPDGSVNPYTLKLSDQDNEAGDWPNIGSDGSKIFIAWEDERIVYQPPFDSMPDIYANVWSLNTPSGSDISYNFGDEKSLVLDAFITSVPIDPPNLDTWYIFEATKTGNVDFDILDGETLQVLMNDISSGKNIASLNADSIRLRARFSRNNPSSSPSLEEWSVTYYGRDEDPPATTIQAIDGIKGLNEYFISEGVTIWLKAQDFPADTGSGVEFTYYTINNGEQLTYNVGSGIQLTVSQSTDWQGSFNVNFWSVDYKGNVENRNEEENKVTINIDAEKPYVEITSPANEEQVETPFWVYADASDNAEIDRVEFDIEPFGEHEGLPYKDYDPPYEWYCDIEKARSIISQNRLFKTSGENVMLRAQVFDKSGQTWLHEIWIYVKNWKDVDFNLKFATGNTLDVEVSNSDDCDSILFTAETTASGETFEFWDYDLSNGGNASFDIHSGMYDVTAHYFEDGNEVYAQYLGSYIYLKIPARARIFNLRNFLIFDIISRFFTRNR